MLFIEVSHEAAAVDREQGQSLDVLRFRAAHNDLLHILCAVADVIRVAEEKATRADGSHGVHAGTAFADKSRIVVFEITPHAYVFRPAAGVGPGRKARDKISA